MKQRKWFLWSLLWMMLFALIAPGMTNRASAAAGTWDQFTYSGSAGSRPYFVYTPANYSTGTPVPLVVMLHGCTQTPADFAAGTQMNALADTNQFLVVYPQQTSSNNQNQCWNFFDPSHQSRNGGEPAIIAEITKTVMKNTARWNVDASRVYVTGLSAGAAMSAIMGATYPDLYAAIGVHSGLEYKAASNMTDAFTAMRQGGPNPTTQGQAAYNAMGSYARVVPTIVFQGTSDYTVYPVNGDQVIQQYMQTDKLASNSAYNANFNSPSKTTTGQVSGTSGKSYTIYEWNDNNGNVVQEYWKINSMGHAWSGGSTGGSYTDNTGPNASQAMYTFFLNHPQGPSVSANPAGGTFNNSVQITLTANPANASIYYTTDGTTPTTSSSKYTAAISLSQSATLKYFAVDSGGKKSAVQTQSYTVNTPAPVITPSLVGNTFGGPVTVSLTSNDPAATIYYTTDGTTPSTSSSKYTSSLTFTSTTTLKYYGINGAGYASPVQTQSYEITAFQLTANPTGGTYAGAQSVSLALNMPGAIYYTTDGSTPTTASALYNGPLAVRATQTVKYIGVDLAGNKSAVQTQTYTITTPPPVQTLTFTSIAAEDGYVYQYSTDGVPNSTNPYLEIGSTSLNHGEAGIVSFDTSSIPANATIVSASLTLYRYDNTLFNYDLGPLTADIASAKGFNNNYALESADYGATAAMLNIGNFDALPTAQYQAISDSISTGALAYLNRTGKTQFRLHFQKPTNNLYMIDVLRFFSTNGSTTYAPTLTVQYQ